MHFSVVRKCLHDSVDYGNVLPTEYQLYSMHQSLVPPPPNVLYPAITMHGSQLDSSTMFISFMITGCINQQCHVLPVVEYFQSYSNWVSIQGICVTIAFDFEYMYKIPSDSIVFKLIMSFNCISDRVVVIP